MIAASWAFFTYSGSSGSSHPRPVAKVQQSILNVQDKRLTKGAENAPVKIVEYADILCPYCAATNEVTMPQVQSNYIDKGLVHYELRLVAMIAPDSELAGEGAYCAADQNKFWDYTNTAYGETWNKYYTHNKMPKDVTLFTQNNISSFANHVGLDVPVWQQCMNQGKYANTIAQNQQKMTEIKAQGTPELIINGTYYSGAPPYSSLKAIIDAELNKAKAGQ